jgi:hypothetical protein
LQLSLLTLIASAMMTGLAAGQEPSDNRVQYPAWLANSFVAVSIGAGDYQFSGEQLPSGIPAPQ